jgi:transglutaminase-like putative cysteine protease
VEQFLKATSVVDWGHPDVVHRANVLRAVSPDPVEIARRCFEWVRDEIKHSGDHQLKPVTCSASEVLQAGSGFCYAKSHLLAALLRANGIATGFCYQRLSQDGIGAPYCLHGLNAVHLPGVGWYRVDPRGNRPGIDAQFVPPREQLAFRLAAPGEIDLPEIWADPLAIVVDALRAHIDAGVLADALPDVIVWNAG